MTCDDAAAFLGPVGRGELAALDRPVTFDDDSAEQVAALGKDSSPTAYLFVCLHCGAHLAYSDAL